MRKLILTDSEWWAVKRAVQTAEIAKTAAADNYKKAADSWCGNPDAIDVLLRAAEDAWQEAKDTKRLLELIDEKTTFIPDGQETELWQT